ncbi:MAG: hypothetical protein IPJ34_18930 [Myxococcales bacterium]|nr:hypothetical protein [Myxococcales bacterium]
MRTLVLLADSGSTSNVSGSPRMVRMFSVTISPVLPSPRVVASTRRAVVPSIS